MSKMEVPEERPPKAPKKFRLRHIFFGIGWGLLALVVFIIAAHGPVIRALLGNTPQFLTKEGLYVSWLVGGNARENLRLDDISIKDETSPLVDFRAAELFVSYDLKQIWRGKIEQIPQLIRLRNPKARIDLTRPSPPPKNRLTTRKPFDVAALDFALPDVHLANGEIDVATKMGEFRIRALYLDLAPSGAGTVKFLVALPWEPDQVRQISAEYSWKSRKLCITNLQLDGETFLPLVELWMPKGPESRMPFALILDHQHGLIAANGTFDPETFSVAASLVARRVTCEKWSTFFPQPLPFQGGIERLNVRIDGNPTDPKRLAVQLEAQTTPLSGAGWSVDRSRLVLSAGPETWNVHRLEAWLGGNLLAVSAAADTPESWALLKSVHGRSQFLIHVIKPDALPFVPAYTTGQLRVTGEVGFGNASLADFTVAGRASDLTYEALRVDELTTHAQGDATHVRFDLAARTLAESLAVTADGALAFDEEKPFQLHWKAQTPHPVELVRAFGVKWPEALNVKNISSQGRVVGDLKSILAHDVASVDAQIQLEGQSVTWENAVCQEARFFTTLKAGVLEIKELALLIDAQNQLHVTAQAPVAPWLAHFSGSEITEVPPSGRAELKLNFSSLPSLAPWFAALGVPVPQSGGLVVDWAGRAEFAKDHNLPLVSGRGSIRLHPTQLGNIKEIMLADILLEHTFDSLTASRLQAQFGPWRLDGAADVDKDLLSLRDIRVSHKDTVMLEASAAVPFIPSEPMSVKIDTAKPITSDVLQKISGQDWPVSGVIQLQADVHGPASALSGFVHVKASDIRDTKKPNLLESPGDLDFRMDIHDGQAEAKVAAHVKPLNTLKITAKSNLDPTLWARNPEAFWTTPLRGSLELEPTSLAFLQKHIPLFRQVSGQISANIQSGGTYRTPVLLGSIDVRNGEFDPVIADMPHVKNLQIKLAGNGSQLRIETFQAQVSGGSVNLGGIVELKDISNPDFDLTLKARDALVKRDATMLIRTDADLQLRGALQQAELTGEVALARSRIFKEIQYAPLASLDELPPLPPSSTAPSKDPNAPLLSPPFDVWKWNVDVTTREPVRLMGNLANGAISADLHVAGTGAKPIVTGRVSFDETRLRFPFSTLVVENGEVIFSEKSPLDPILELKAKSQVNGYDVVLRGYGRAVKPKIVFTSSPPLSDGDIATLLATGQTASSLSGGGEGLEGQAAFYVLSQAYRSMFKKDLYDASKPPKLSVSHSTAGGGLGGIVGTYKMSKNTRLECTVRADGGFRSVFRYLFRFQ